MEKKYLKWKEGIWGRHRKLKWLIKIRIWLMWWTVIKHLVKIPLREMLPVLYIYLENSQVIKCLKIQKRVQLRKTHQNILSKNMFNQYHLSNMINNYSKMVLNTFNTNYQNIINNYRMTLNTCNTNKYLKTMILILML